MCTLRNFPNQIEHCIEWGRDLFDKFFFGTPNDAASYLDKPMVFLAQIKQNTTSSGVRSAMEEIKKLIDLKKSADFNKCVEIARGYFDEYFDHSIQNLLSIFPEDAKDKEGAPFWSGPKRAPHPVHYDAHDPLHSHFVTAAANLIAFTLGIPQNRDVEYCARVAASAQVSQFVPKKIKIELPGDEKKEPEPEVAAPEDEEVIAELLAQLKVEDIGVDSKTIFACEFEKDDDNNYHIDFIHACSNLRARNY